MFGVMSYAGLVSARHPVDHYDLWFARRCGAPSWGHDEGVFEVTHAGVIPDEQRASRIA